MKALLLVFFSISTFPSGWCLVENVSPPSGSIVAGFEGTLNASTLMCDVVFGGLQLTTTWSIENFGQSTGLQAITADLDLFLLTGDPLPLNSSSTLTFHNRLVIRNLTSELDGVTVYCGTGQDPQQASFLLRIYRAPSLLDNIQLTSLEGTEMSIVDLRMQPNAFPFPTFEWMKNGIQAVNTSGRVVYGYPSVTFYNVSRSDAATYTLFAENFAIDTQIIGNDTGSFTIDVLYGPEINESSSNLFATLEEDDVTLTCGSNLVGNPPPVVTWLSNTNAEIGLSDDRLQINSGPDIVSLTIFNATQNDNGTWRCVLTSSAPNGTLIQQLERNLTLIILIAPSEPMNATVVSFGAVWIAVSWLEPVFIGVPALTRFEVSADPTKLNITNANSSLSLVTPPQRAIVNVSSDMLYANISGLFPGQQYRLSVAALIQFGDVRARSNSSADVFITTHTTAPEILCLQTPESADGKIKVVWAYRHTGGLDLIQVTVDYQILQNEDGIFQIVSMNPSLTLGNDVEALNLTAGYTYIFRIRASNEAGEDDVECPPVYHTLGAPQQPEINRAVSPSPGVVMLDISTDEAGIEDGEPIEFVVKTELSAGSTSNLFIQEIMNYEDSSIISLTMNNLVPGARYQFSAKVQNKFGVSEFSNVIELQVQASSSDSTSSAAAIAGGVVSSVVTLILIIAIILIIIMFISCRKAYVTRLEKNKFSSTESDMVQNNLYKSHTTYNQPNSIDSADIDSHYADIPVITTSRPTSAVYDAMSTPTSNHKVKQSDNPLYSSTQELRLSASYDTIPSRGHSQTPSDQHPDHQTSQELISHGTSVSPLSHNISGPGTTSPTRNNRLSYSIELQLSSQAFPFSRHQRSLSQGMDTTVYTEL